MELKEGLKFKAHYHDDNVNNIASCEVLGIVDDYIIVLWCEKDATKMNKKKGFYKSINKHEFDLNIANKVYLPL